MKVSYLRWQKLSCACALSLELSCGLVASHAQDHRPESVRRTLIRAGHVVDVQTGKEIDDQTIVVTGSRITGISLTSTVKRNPEDEEIDLRAFTVLPGLIDVHTHLTSDPVSGVAPLRETSS